MNSNHLSETSTECVEMSKGCGNILHLFQLAKGFPGGLSVSERTCVAGWAALWLKALREECVSWGLSRLQGT